MALFEASDELTREELAWELVEIFDDLDVNQINEVLTKNVPLETLKFFTTYAREFGESHSIEGDACKRLPNLLLLGYLLRVVEVRLVGDIDGESLDS
jgi:hypothetical protein